MRYQLAPLLAIAVGFLATSKLFAQDANISLDAIRSAISKAIPQLEKGAAGSADQRTCFTCHNQALPVFALVEAKRRGFSVDETNLKQQIVHTTEHLQRGRKEYLEGRGQGGRVLTAGYALWALEAGGCEPDELTTAVTSYLIDYQKESARWSHPGNRPPSSGSDFTTTYVALRGLAVFGTDEQRAKIDQRKAAIRDWLINANPTETEDRVFRLRSLAYVDAPPDIVQMAADVLIESQRDDGGWSQLPDMQSDAYATATALAALLEDGGVAANEPIIQRGIQYLLDTQLDDGTWHVVTRAKGFQTYFESGFPHEKDQFISIAASSWATLALTLTLPESP